MAEFDKQAFIWLAQEVAHLDDLLCEVDEHHDPQSEENIILASKSSKAILELVNNILKDMEYLH